MSNLNIGPKIQQYRTQRGMSLRALAEMTGITASMISQIEKNGVNPSIKTLKAISDALEFPLYILFQEETDPEKDLIVRKDEYLSLGNGKNEVEYNLLTSDTRGIIEFIQMVIPANTVTADKEGRHIGEETAYVEHGRVYISLNGREYLLNQGDAVKIPAGTGHRWFNRTKEEVRVIFAITPPSF